MEAPEDYFRIDENDVPERVRRYFDETETEKLTRPKFPKTHLPNPPPMELDTFILQMLSLSKDICVLYSRLSILRILKSLPVLSDESIRIFFSVFLENSTKIEADIFNSDSPISLSCLDCLFMVIRITSSCSMRMRIYSNIMAQLSSDEKIPKNLGSVESIGGVVFLDSVTDSLSMIIREILRSNGDQFDYFMDFILELLSADLNHFNKKYQLGVG